MPAPLIAINGQYVPGDKPALKLHQGYVEAVARAGGIPVVIPALLESTRLAELLDRIDGLLLTGGDDFHTEPLGLGPTHPEAVPTVLAKQEFDLGLARTALDRGIPVLGICYGMQCLGLSTSGLRGARPGAESGAVGFLQHVPADRPGSQEHRNSAVHDVGVTPDSKLARALGVERVSVISRHHQALDRVGPPWIVSAMDDEGLVEGIERADHPFAIGVQWHPELSPPESPHGRLLAAHVDAAGAARRVRI